MISSLPLWLRSVLPGHASVSQTERLRSATGALLGILFTGLLAAEAMGPAEAAWLMAPMGASAVLLFGVPGSPLAQPWSVLGGNVVAAVIGVTCARFVSDVVVASALAIFFAIGAMFALRCLHPPSGAIALTAVLGGPQVHAAGYAFVLAPVALNSVLMLAAAILYNKAVGRRYPHSQLAEPQHPHHTADLPPSARLGFTPADMQAVLKEYDQVLDVSADDLEDLFHRTEMHAYRRRFGDTRCADIMSSDIVAVEYATELAEAWRLMQAHAVQGLPVVDSVRRVIGIVTRSDFLRQVDAGQYPRLGQRLRALLTRTPNTHTDKAEAVGQIMTPKARTVLASTPLAELVPLMSDGGLHHVPVVDHERRLVGMITQTDLIAALYKTSLAGLRESPRQEAATA